MPTRLPLILHQPCAVAPHPTIPPHLPVQTTAPSASGRRFSSPPAPTRVTTSLASSSGPAATPRSGCSRRPTPRLRSGARVPERPAGCCWYTAGCWPARLGQLSDPQVVLVVVLLHLADAVAKRLAQLLRRGGLTGGSCGRRGGCGTGGAGVAAPTAACLLQCRAAGRELHAGARRNEALHGVVAGRQSEMPARPFRAQRRANPGIGDWVCLFRCSEGEVPWPIEAGVRQFTTCTSKGTACYNGTPSRRPIAFAAFKSSRCRSRTRSPLMRRARPAPCWFAVPQTGTA